MDAADSYVSVAAFRTYMADFHGSPESGYSDADMERALRRATQFVDAHFDFAGARSKSTQRREFPRAGLTDASGFEVAGVPRRIVEATCELAYRALSEDLMPDIERANKVRSETIGSISTTYADDAPESKLFRVAEKIVAPFVIGTGPASTSRMLPPVFGGSTEGAFTLGGSVG